MLRTRRARWAVIAVSAVISLACVLWWADRADLLPGRGGDAEVAGGDPADAGTGDAAAVDGEVIPLGAATYSLAGPGASSGRLELALVATAGDAPERVLERRALFDDAVIATLLTYTAEELRSADGADQLRGELLRHARELYPDLGIQRVLITGLQVQ